MEKIKKIICPSCNAEYEDTLPKCPYCDLINYKGAEKAYLDKLEDVREDMGELAYVPENTAKEEFKKQGHLVRKIVIIIIIVLVLLFGVGYLLDNISFGGVSEKEQFLWQAENYPKFDALYEAGEYEELARIMDEELLGEYSIWSYEHRAFAFVYGDIMKAKEAMRLIDTGEDTSQKVYTRLLYSQVDLIIQWERDDELSEEERAIIEPLLQEVWDDYYTRWQFSEEENAEIFKTAEENYHVLPYGEAEKIVEKWLKKNK